MEHREALTTVKCNQQADHGEVCRHLFVDVELRGQSVLKQLQHQHRETEAQSLKRSR